MTKRTQLFCAVVATLLFASVALAQARGGIQITKGPIVEHTDATTAIIAWSTNEPSSTVVKYGTTRDQMNQTAQLPWGALTHRVTIKNLEAGQTYYFQVESGQAQGSRGDAESRVDSFTTTSLDRDRNRDRGPAARDRDSFHITNGPVVEHISDNTAIVAWSTDRPSSTIVRYGNDPNHLDRTAEQPWGATNHRVEITSLQPNTQYYFVVHSAQGLNAPGQRADSEPIPFRTSGTDARNDHRRR